MENTVKIKKKDALKPCSIIAGALLVLLALWTMLVSPSSVVVEAFSAWYYGYAAFYVLLNAMFEIVPVIVSVIAMLAAAIILFVNKNSSAIFIPMGLLTYTASIEIIRAIADPFTEFGASLISMIISIPIAAVLALIFFFASSTFLKEKKFILMFIIFGILVLGLLGNVLTTIMLILLGLGNWAFVFEYYGLITIIKAYQIFIYPMLVFINTVVLGVATLLAAIGMCSQPKAVVAETVAEETTEPSAE